MELHRHPELADQLAAAYVLGTLRGAARDRFQHLLSRDAALAQRVARWEDRLMPAALAVAPKAPPHRLWAAIAERLPRAPLAKRRTGDRAWWRRLVLWQGLSGALATALLVVMLWPTPPAMPYMAIVDNAQGQATWVLHANRNRMRLVTLRSTPVPAHKSLQLWAIVPGQRPVSMGLLPVRSGTTPILPAPDHMNLQQARLIAVTMEPAGGSPTGQPTGPILFKANLVDTL